MPVITTQDLTAYGTTGGRTSIGSSIAMRKRLAGVRGEHAAGLGQAAAATVSLHEPLACGSLEQSQVRACARLTDPDRAGRARDAPLPFELDEQAQPGRIPQQRERAIGSADTRHRHFRLAR